MPGLDTSRITDALAFLRGVQLRVFGADVHGFRLNPPLPEADVTAFETLHNVSLPYDFRQFLTDVGNGGAGSFPLGEEWNDISSQPSAELADRDESEYDRQMHVFQRAYWDSSLVNGAIPICHEGCALRIWLVLTGAQSGYLWEDRRSEYGGLKPLRLADGSPATFTGWYDARLNNCLNSDEYWPEFHL